eukprot:4147404-Amphidinium_carterae.1
MPLVVYIDIVASQLLLPILLGYRRQLTGGGYAPVGHSYHSRPPVYVPSPMSQEHPTLFLSW